MRDIEIIVAALVVCSIMSMIALVMMWRDKRAAMRGSARPEAMLHTLGLLGGWPGVLLGQRMFRHKSRKLSFRLVQSCVIALHMLGWLAVLWWRFGAENGGW